MPEQNTDVTAQMIINMVEYLPVSTVNGPGRRFVLWVQGCRLDCRECFNAAYRPVKPAIQAPVPALLEQITAVRGIDGVTFSGGEPFLQAAPLAALAAGLQENSLSVVTYSGYTLEEITTRNHPDWNNLLAHTDLLIDGPYVKEIPTTLPWQGSGNQRLHFLTDRFNTIKAEINTVNKGFEIHLGPGGKIQVTGFPFEARGNRDGSVLETMISKLDSLSNREYGRKP